MKVKGVCSTVCALKMVNKQNRNTFISTRRMSLRQREEHAKIVFFLSKGQRFTTHFCLRAFRLKT